MGAARARLRVTAGEGVRAVTTLADRQARWQGEAERNGGTHPLVRNADTRLLRRMRARALPPLRGAGLSEA